LATAPGAGSGTGANEIAIRRASGTIVLGFADPYCCDAEQLANVYPHGGVVKLIKFRNVAGGFFLLATLSLLVFTNADWGLAPSHNVELFLSKLKPKLSLCSTTPTGSNNIFNPNDPARSGYELVLDSEFNNFSDFDLSCTAPPQNTGCINPQGKNWYLDSWTFPTNANTTNAATDLAISNGILSIHQSIQTGNWAISTMAPSNGASHGPAAWQQNWNGKVFTGGWYVEARIASEYRDNTTGLPVTAPGASQGHASFWAYAIDHFNNANPGGLWPGQGSTYTHFVENDMIDGFQGDAFYQTNLFDWYGINNTTNPAKAVGTGMNQNNQVNVTQFGFPNTAFANKAFHIIGQLWVPATATTQGYLQNYVDGVPTSKFTWNQYDSTTPSPPTGANIANIIDQDHMSVILGADPPHAGETSSVTMFVDWVHAWQLPAAATASGNTIITPQANFTGGNGSCAGSFIPTSASPG
jgi:hypothetical protein